MAVILHNSYRGKYVEGLFPVARDHISPTLYSQKVNGVPFNISSYALLTHMVAHVCRVQVGDFIYSLGDYHIYRNHLDQVKELLAREPLQLPRLEIADGAGELRGLEGLLRMSYQELNLVGYKSHGKIAAPIAI